MSDAARIDKSKPIDPSKLSPTDRYMWAAVLGEGHTPNFAVYDGNEGKYYTFAHSSDANHFRDVVREWYILAGKRAASLVHNPEPFKPSMINPTE